MAGTHSPATNQLVINGVLITDLLEDGVTNEPLEEMGEITIRLDGGLAYSYRPTRGRRFTIACDPTGRGYRELSEIRQGFEDTIRAGNPAPALPFIWVDPVNGTKSVSGVCLFMDRPMAQGGKSVAPATFTLIVDPSNETHGIRNI